MADDAALFVHVRDTLLSDDRFTASDEGIHCQPPAGPVTNIFPVALHPEEWSGWEVTAPGMPDPRSMTVLVLECRSAEWIAQIGARLTRGLDADVWFVDSSDHAWPAGQVDPDRVRLG